MGLLNDLFKGNFMLGFIKRKKKLSAIIIIIGIVFLSVIYYSRGRAKINYELITVERGNIAQEVSVTGRVKAAEQVSLAFERSGKIAAVYVKVGDKAVKNQLLAAQVTNDLAAQLAQASAGVAGARATTAQYQAALERERVKLDELKRGSRPEEITIAEQTLKDAEANLINVKSKAEIDLANVYDSVSDILNDAYTKADDAVNKQADSLFTNDTSASPKLSFTTFNTQVTTDVEWQRILAGDNLKQLKAITEVTGQALANAKIQLMAIRTFLNKANDALRDALSLGQTTIDTYRAAINTGLSNVNTVLASVNNQQQVILSQPATNQNNLAAAQAKVNDAKNQLALTRAGAAPEQVAAQAAQVRQAEANLASQQAQIRQAEANLANAGAQLQKSAMRAPFAGLITVQDAKVGEIVAANAELVSLISEAAFQIEANVPEVDIDKVAIDAAADTTLDAYGSDAHFGARVAQIDPAETIIEGVSTYKVKLQFNQEDERIKSGMTANVIIMAARREGTLIAPQRTVSDQDGKKMIRLLRGTGSKQTVEAVEVKTGLRGTDGNIEILEGVSEGDKVVVGEKTK